MRIHFASVEGPLDDTYTEIMHWNKSTFDIPYGKNGHELASELSALYGPLLILLIHLQWSGLESHESDVHSAPTEATPEIQN